MDYNYFNAEGGTYAYTISGEGEPLLLLHGFTGSSLTWEPFLVELQTTYQVITIDLPGHGKTTNASTRLMEEFCNDLNDFLTHLKLDKVHLLGYSMGARAALSFAQYYPARILSLILESASPGLRTIEERQARKLNDEKLAGRILTEGLDTFITFWENIPLFETQKRLHKDKQNAIRAERLMHSEIGLANSLKHMGTGSQPSWWNSLQSLTCPVMLIVGELDEKFVRINEEMHEQIEFSQLIVIKDAGHTVHVEQVEKFVKIVIRFISSINK